MPRRGMFAAIAAIAGVLLITAAPPAVPHTNAQTYPEVIPLPNGWQPEGIVVGKGPVVYSGSRANGGIYQADLTTGEGGVLVGPQEDRTAIGLSYDDRTGYIFVAGGPGGAAYVYDSRTGESIADFALPTCEEGTFVNDVVVTRDAAYLTDSQCPVIYRIPLGAGGSLPGPGDVQAIELTGDYEQQPGFNANGIDATPNGKELVIVQSNTGLLFNVSPQTGDASAIDLGGEFVTSGDGILLQGRDLYVVRNSLNIVASVRLAPDRLSGEVAEEITRAEFDVPTTVAAHGTRLYVINARFGVANPDSAEYDIIRVP